MSVCFSFCNVVNNVFLNGEVVQNAESTEYLRGLLAKTVDPSLEVHNHIYFLSFCFCVGGGKLRLAETQSVLERWVVEQTREAPRLCYVDK